jgi:hypothetical protein
MNLPEIERSFEYENAFYLTAPVARISKFVTHLELFKRISGLYGEIIECGVFKGNSLNRWIKFRALLENVSSRKIAAFDSFGQFPPSRFEIDQKKRSEFIQETGGGASIRRDELLSVLKELHLEANVELIEGDICETVPQYVTDNPHLKIALLNIDVDLYEPTKIILETCYSHVVHGGIVILDDYGAMTGANKAIDEFFSDGRIKIEKLPYANAISFVQKP